MNAVVLGKWPRAEKSYQFQGKTEALFLRSTITMKRFVTLRGKKITQLYGRMWLVQECSACFQSFLLQIPLQLPKLFQLSVTEQSYFRNN